MATMRVDEDILRLLTDEELDELVNLYKNKYGTSNFHYILMYNQCKWNVQLAQLGVDATIEHVNDEWIAFRKRFYTNKNCDFRKYGTYVYLHMDIMQSVSFHSWEPDLKEMFECLQNTQLIDWSSGPLLTNVDLHYCEQIKKMIEETKNVSVQKARKCHGLILNKGKAARFQIPNLPAEYVMRKLEPECAELIHAQWPNNKEGSLQYICGLIQLNKTLGIFRAVNNELVAWIFQNDYSGLGILQVTPAVQRNSFGSILAAHLSREIAATEPMPVSAWILIENFKSEALLEKIGFEKYVINEWIQLKNKL